MIRESEDAIMARVETVVVMGRSKQAIALLGPRIVPLANYESQLRRCWLYQAHHEAGERTNATQVLTVIRACMGTHSWASLVAAEFFAFVGELDLAEEAALSWARIAPDPGWTAEDYAQESNYHLEQITMCAAAGMAPERAVAWSAQLREHLAALRAS
ncbi:MAG: hypothetical protein IPK74_19965 [Deltaproteobacteria bacterium]|nr:hypothetical protein [Deltaproteobacteria bacterium]